MKKLVVGLLVAALAVVSAVPTVVRAEDTLIATASLLKPEITPEATISGGKAVMKYSWNAVEGAAKYVYHYNLNYDETGVTENVYETAETTSTSVELVLGKDYGNVWIEVAASNEDGSALSEFSESWWTADNINANIDMEGYQKNANKAMVEKGKALIKKKSPKSSYLVYDIDKDGINELIYMRHYNRTEAFFYRYDTTTDKVVPMKIAGKKSIGGVSCIGVEKKKVIIFLSGSAYSGAINTYKLTSSGSLKATLKYTYDYSKRSFKKNGKSIGVTAMEKYMKKMSGVNNLMSSKKVVHSK